jgi:CRP/FNR family cyclic AMP-dependent transcriptional regulator
MAHDVSLSAGPHTATSRPPGGMPGGPTRGTVFDLKTFLSQAGDGSTTLRCQKHQILFRQGDAANAVFYILEGLVKLSVVSQQGKEAVVAILEGGDFFGEACLAGQVVCMATATSLDASTIVRIDRATMKRALYYEPAFSELVMSHLVTRNVRIQEDLIDQLFNSAEKRLARTLLLLAHFGREDNPKMVIPRINQETLAEMVGTTRSRVSFFLNRFKKLGFIEYINYNAGYQVHSSLINVVLPSANTA